ncbi:MAG: NAD-dependent epimerase/dehydratase family protein [Oligoflexia bacterium]|nr:NAD-dependent epimerase/dehydratase family protein [Oligoflexia bacterium]
MKVLIIGGNRFFGKRLAANLIGRNFEVTLLNRGQIPDGFGSKVDRIQIDRNELHSNHSLIQNRHWDIIFDQVCYDAFEAMSACRCFESKTKKYVFISTQSVYGLGQNIPESSFDPKTEPLDPIIKRGHDYGKSKRQAEAIFSKSSFESVTSVRFPIVLGIDDYTQRLKFHIDRINKGEPIYFQNLRSKLSFIHAEDAAEFLSYLVDHNVNGPINCCSNDPISLEELVRLIEQILGKKVVLASSGETNRSPFSMADDWHMDTTKLTEIGFLASPISHWLPGLVKQLAHL